MQINTFHNLSCENMDNLLYALSTCIYILCYTQYSYVFHYLCIYNEMRKSTNIMYCSYGSRPEARRIDFDGVSQMVLLSSYIKKKKKRKRNRIHHPICSVIHYSLDS